MILLMLPENAAAKAQAAAKLEDVFAAEEIGALRRRCSPDRVEPEHVAVRRV